MRVIYPNHWTTTNRTQTRGHSLNSAPILPKAVVIGCGGGVAFGHGMTFSNSQMSPTTTGHTQEGKRAGGRTTRHSKSSHPIVHTFIFSQAHLFMLESTPYFLKTATWTDDLTPLLSTTGYCWKAVEMSAQQVRVLSTKKETFVACT